MREPNFSGPSSQKMVQAISQDLDDLGFIEGKDYIAGARGSGRTTRMLKDALLQIPWMDPGDEIFVVAHTWEYAKKLAELVGNELAKEMGIEREKFLGSNANQKTIEGWKSSPDGFNQNRYFLTFKENKHIHFVAIHALEHTLIGRRLTHDPAIFIDHYCYEFGYVQNADYDLYALLNSIV